MQIDIKYPIEKNVKLTEKIVKDNLDNFKDIGEYFINYPDIFLDWIKPRETSFNLFFYQRLFLRANLRYRYVYTVAPRAFSKSFISILAGYLKCMFMPNEKFFLCAPGKEQGARIATEKLNEIWNIYPMLKKELAKKNMGKDYVTLVFNNGSVFDVVGALDTTRGGRRNGGIIDELRDHEPDTLNEVVLPLLNVSRRDPDGTVDPTEPNQCQLYITSASNRGSFAYEKLLELFIQSIISPETTFVWGCDYRVPMLHDLLDKRYIENLKLSPTFKIDSFAREYLSCWTGGSDDSWIKWENLSKYRTICNPEKRKILGDSKDVFYYISVDVARIGVLTSIQIFKVIPKQTYFLKKLVNSIDLHDMHFSQQAIEIKKAEILYQPREILIDGTGLGVGLMDFLVLDQTDPQTGAELKGLASINDEEYKQYPGKRIIYVLKANSTLNGKIHGNCYSQIINGHCRFLIDEQTAKMKLLSLVKAKTMSSVEKIERLSPHMRTTNLFTEICNLKIKNVGSDMAVTQMSGKINKDRFSAFEYGLWRIKDFEDDYFKKASRKKRNFKDFVFFSGGK